ncbi:hypothetical protein [Nonomuraea sp. NEAU-A123]|uniref:hypothetical protein n=1 Tax=Nonomuraea sp. NEAU-A123 TaxID=2839649 RepID=UPI001BE4A796|nr:hypothetical protein [Nonomuraea sp. NEAU-A123]MBT2235561.1 hypothetical protein [Nonomuraea sp. NEAU-A123]
MGRVDGVRPVYRVVVFSATLLMAGALLGLGLEPLVATGVAGAVMAGCVEITWRLTAPDPAPRARIGVIVLVWVVVVVLLGRGYSPLVVVPAVLGMAAVAAEVARRFAGMPYRVPRLVF